MDPADTVAASTDGLFAISPPGTRKCRAILLLVFATRKHRFRRRLRLVGTACVCKQRFHLALRDDQMPDRWRYSLQ